MRRRKKNKKSLGYIVPIIQAAVASKVVEKTQKEPERVYAKPVEQRPREARPKKYEEPFLDEQDKKIIKRAAYIGTGLILTGIGFLVVRKIVRKTLASNAEKEAMTDNSDENFAKRLIMAFDNNGWWGTDVEAVRQVFVQMPSKQTFVNVMKEYKRLKQQQRELVPDLTEELTSTEYYEMQNILAAKPDKTGGPPPADFLKIQAKTFARRLRSALSYTVMGFPATDEDAIKQVLVAIPTRKVFVATAYMYEHDYGTKLSDDLNGDLGVNDFSWQQMVLKKPNG